MIDKVVWLVAALLASRRVVDFLSGGTEPQLAPQPAAEPFPALPPAEATGAEVLTPAVSSSRDDPTQDLKEANRSLALLGGAMTLAVVGVVVHPLFRVLSLPFLIGGFYPHARDAWRAIKDEGRVNYSALEVMQGTAELFAGRIALTALGGIFFAGGRRTLLAYRRETREELLSAFGQADESAWVVRGAVELQIPLRDIQIGDVLVVRAGDQIPVDGSIVEGALGVDQRALTGESRLEELAVGDGVLAATTVLSGTARILAERTGSDTLAARVDQLLAKTVSYEQTLSHRVAVLSERSIPATMAMVGYGFLTRGPVGMVGGFWTNGIDIAWANSPYSMHNTIKAASDVGLLIADGRSLEQLSTIDTVVFDKTGTLTVDQLEVIEVYAAPGHDPRELLRVTAALESNQHHPIARAILEAAAGLGHPSIEVADLGVDVGYGLRGTLSGRAVVLGSSKLMARLGVKLPSAIRRIARRSEDRGCSLLYLAVDSRFAGAIELYSRARPEAAVLIERLRARGHHLVIVTGDEEGPANALAGELGIEDYVSRALPEEKAEVVSRLQREGRRVCYVGDGINDTLAMRRANVSVTLGGASPHAVESAQVVIQHGSLLALDVLFEIGRTYDQDQRVILKTAMGATALSMAGFLLTGIGLPGQVVMYLAGFGLSLGVASLPRIRDYGAALREPARRPEGPPARVS